MTYSASWVAACAAGVVTAASLALGAGATPDLRQEAERLRFENEILETKAELASGDAFYVILDPSGRSMTLVAEGRSSCAGTTWRASTGRGPRVAFVARGDAPEWQGKIWKGGTLAPQREQDRVEIKAPPPGADESTQPEPVVPPTPEEKYPVPVRYGIRYEGGLFLEILPVGEAHPNKSMGNRFCAWWDDAKEAVSSEPTDRLRLRVSLRHEDAEALYRSIPPGTKLLVLPPAK